MCEELSYQIINTSAVNQAAFCCKFAKIIVEKISIDGSKQDLDTLFRIHLRETWLNVFILL